MAGPLSPSARIVLASAQPLRTIDAEGRRIDLRRMNALDRLRLFKAAGPSLSQNHYWLGMASLAFSVVAIDDVPVPSPANEMQIEGVVSRLGDAGIAAVAKALHADEGASVKETGPHSGN